MKSVSAGDASRTTLPAPFAQFAGPEFGILEFDLSSLFPFKILLWGFSGEAETEESLG